MSLLISSLSDEVMYLAVGRDTSRAVWTLITSALGSSTRARCLNLLAQFQSLRQGDSSPGEYLGRAQLLVEDLALAGRLVSLDEQNLYVFRGLRPEFRSMASSLAASGNPITIPQLADFLQAQEFIWAEDFLPAGGVPAASHQALHTGRGQRGGSSSGGGSRGSGSGGGVRGRNDRGSRGGWQNRGRGGGVPRCQICRNQGHTAVHCYRRYDQAPPQAHVAVSGEDGGTVADGWFPDTGATSHATPDATMMAHSDSYTGGDVLRVGNESGLDISSIGSASINSVSGSLALNDILHVPNLSVPLLSVNRFTTDNNVFFEFHRDFFVVKDCRTKTVLLKGSSMDTPAVHPSPPWASGPLVPHKPTKPPLDVAPLAVQHPLTIQERPLAVQSQPAPRRVRRRAPPAQPQERAHVMRLRHMKTGEPLQALTVSADPTCYTQAVGYPEWRDAMDQE
ncbi:PREDICTED: uncharacterized protein LOC109155159 [Ipomoea nil]|uniref:uncharacterized protein LOC109155159 n=1 Tax=Ipomoea nil TaxID=35883 RepID=UPI00090138EA|nr:PREDICTED: uncharacterized protein LOC109155159 [Ipomoea nil]